MQFICKQRVPVAEPPGMSSRQLLGQDEPHAGSAVDALSGARSGEPARRACARSEASPRMPGRHAADDCVLRKDGLGKSNPGADPRKQRSFRGEGELKRGLQRAETLRGGAVSLSCRPARADFVKQGWGWVLEEQRDETPCG